MSRVIRMSLLGGYLPGLGSGIIIGINPSPPSNCYSLAQASCGFGLTAMPVLVSLVVALGLMWDAYVLYGRWMENTTPQ